MFLVCLSGFVYKRILNFNIYMYIRFFTTHKGLLKKTTSVFSISKQSCVFFFFFYDWKTAQPITTRRFAHRHSTNQKQRLTPTPSARYKALFLASERAAIMLLVKHSAPYLRTSTQRVLRSMPLLRQ